MAESVIASALCVFGAALLFLFLVAFWKDGRRGQACVSELDVELARLGRAEGAGRVPTWRGKLLTMPTSPDAANEFRPHVESIAQ